MKTFKQLINEAILYHGGSYDGKGPISHVLLGTGEPGGIRPLGPGLYLSDTLKIAKLYQDKYGGNLVKFKLDDNANIFAKGNAWKLLNKKQQEWQKKKRIALQKVFEKEGLVQKSYWTDKYTEWDIVVKESGHSKAKKEKIRKLLVKNGVDGMFEILGDGKSLEYAIYNFNKLKVIK